MTDEPESPSALRPVDPGPIRRFCVCVQCSERAKQGKATDTVTGFSVDIPGCKQVRPEEYLDLIDTFGTPGAHERFKHHLLLMHRVWEQTPLPQRGQYVRFEGIEDADLPPDPTNPECSGSIETCDRDCGECMVCGARDCPQGEPLHYHHDGCPACTPPDQRPPEPIDLKRPRLDDIDRLLKTFPYKFPTLAVSQVLRSAAEGVAPAPEALDALRRARDKYAAVRALRSMLPLQAVLHCPVCGTRHVDEGEWASRLHTTHLCASCHYEWRVEPYCVGIPDTPTVTEEDHQALALALAVLSLQYPVWTDYVYDLARRMEVLQPYLQFRASKRGEVAEAPDSPLVSRVEALEAAAQRVKASEVQALHGGDEGWSVATREQLDHALQRRVQREIELEAEVRRLKNKCARYVDFASHHGDCQIRPTGICSCGLAEMLVEDVNWTLQVNNPTGINAWKPGPSEPTYPEAGLETL